MSDAIEQFEAHGCTVSIYHDEDCKSPRTSQDCFGTIAHWHRSYDFGDNIREQGPEEFLRELARIHISDRYPESCFEKRWNEILEAHYLVLPVCLLDHSGLHIWIGTGAHASDPGGWDSGQVGFIYVSLENARENWLIEKKHPRCTWDYLMDDWNDNGENTGQKISLRKAAERLLEGEIKEYDQYLRGEVYGYVVKGRGDEESCWGFVGDIDYVKSEAVSAARNIEVSSALERLKETEVV